MGMWEAVAMGVGTMIGASIFSIFGLGAEIAGSGLPVAFGLSAVLALMVAYSYAKLSSRITSNSGPIEFILRGLGDGVATGTLSILMWLSYVVSIALFSTGFAGYFIPLVGVHQSRLATSVVQVVLIIAFMTLNFWGSRAVGRVEALFVAIKLSLLGALIVAGAWFIDPSRIVPGTDVAQVKGVLFAMAVFLLSYMGFGLITNASENIEDPKRNVPRAIYVSIGIVAMVYVLVSIVVVGNLPLDQIVQAQDNALAEAARPSLGAAGFLMISVGALFSISSALNATLYGGANIGYSLAKEGELPELFERKVWFGSTEGLYLTAALSMLFALGLNLNGIASITSGIFIVIYLFVIASHYRLVGEVGGSRALVAVNLGTISAFFAVLLYYQWLTDRTALLAIALTFLVATAVEIAYRKRVGRVISAGRYDLGE